MEAAYRHSFSVEGERLTLHYLGPRDEPWLRVLLDECARFAGKKQVELRERLAQPLPGAAPRGKLRLAIQLLERLLPEAPRREPSSREVRARVFRAAVMPHASRREVFERVAAELRVEVARVEDSLFADLAGQRRVAALPQDLSAQRLAQLTNQALVLAFLKRAERIRVRAWGGTHALVRFAQRLGLICIASPVTPLSGDETPGVMLEISGPLSLFHKTEIYGRALARLLPRSARCRHFELEADCVLARGARLTTLHVSPYDPIYPARELPPADARIEVRFARDFEKLARDWQLVREPDPIDAAGTLIFADFELVHRREPARRWLLELVGFWTPESLREKLARLAAAHVEHLILCVDDERRCSEADLAPDARVLRYRKRVDVAELLAIVEGGP